MKKPILRITLFVFIMCVYGMHVWMYVCMQCMCAVCRYVCSIHVCVYMQYACVSVQLCVWSSEVSPWSVSPNPWEVVTFLQWNPCDLVDIALGLLCHSGQD